MMTHCVYFYLLFLLFFIINDARKPDDPLQGTNSVCADVCTPSEPHVELDLSEPRIYRENEHVQIMLHHTGSGRCREPALLKIPLDTIGKHGIVKFELNFGPVLHNFSIDIGINDENNNTIRNVNVFNQQVSIEYRSNTENQVNINEQSVTLLEPGEHLTIYISNEWIHIENKQRTQQKLTMNLNKTNLFLFNQNSSQSHLLIGLNRNIDGKQTGIGLCSANLTFIECHADQQSALDIDVNNKTFEQRDLQFINWISHLNYLDPNADIRECTAQGVVRLTFDPNGSRRIARFDLTMGSQIQGFTFNIGDSATNNGYGGDGGTTSNSAEIHSNDNRFYIWANTKICGDTLLLKIDYNVIEPFDNITIFISNDRVELTNYRSYHQILQSPYLYALARQNVTCNCFDSLCYPGVQPDNDIYFGINRVIGGTYRPGTGVCDANVNWIQCKKIEVSPRIKYEPVTITTTGVTTTTTTTTTVTSAPRIKYEPVTITTTGVTTTTTTVTSAPTTMKESTTIEAIKHTNEMIRSTESSSSVMTTEESNKNASSSTSAPSTMIHFEEINSTISNIDYNTTNEEHINSTNTIEEESSSTVLLSTHQPGLFHLLANLSQHIITGNSTAELTFVELNSTLIDNETSTTKLTTSSTNANPCTTENLRANFVYHEYTLDKHKFIFCDSEGKMNIIACSPNYIWSQNEQSCILPD